MYAGQFVFTQLMDHLPASTKCYRYLASRFSRKARYYNSLPGLLCKKLHRTPLTN